MSILRQLARLLGVLTIAALALQFYFVARVALMAQVDPSSTTFQRTQAVRLMQRDQRLAWSKSWMPLRDMGTALPRAVIASEDAGFVDHRGLEWDAIQKARDRNQRRQSSANRQTSTGAAAAGKPERLMGGSTITQQLAKNLFLSGERTYWRKGQEAAITWVLETTLSKSRILEIYLNSVEWGEGVYGAKAASDHYFRTEPQRLQALQAARLAVMLPAPRRFERLPNSPYLAGRSETIAARMPAVALPEGLR
jgi:monofunctional biosynthetic peptidoglycan transglycosylase